MAQIKHCKNCKHMMVIPDCMSKWKCEMCNVWNKNKENKNDN